MKGEALYRTAKVNIHLYRVYKGDVLVGQVRMGLDSKWYPELPPTQFKAGAVHALVLAHEAIKTVNNGVS